MATTFMTERLMKAADALLQHGECIEVVYCGPGERRTCRLAGRGEQPETVRLSIWTPQATIMAKRPVRYTECSLPAPVAREQETEPRFDPVTGRKFYQPAGAASAEVAKAIQFGARARQRRRNGQFADALHRAEPAGVR